MVDDGVLHAAAKEMRHSYQLGLLAWLRNDKPEQAFDSLHEIVEKLLVKTANQRLLAMWWIAAGLLDAVRGDQVKAGASIKRIMGQIDRELKRFSEGDTTVSTASDELMKICCSMLSRHDQKVEAYSTDSVYLSSSGASAR